MPKKRNKNHGNNQHLRQGNISLILDTYDDIFSDFDPRHYSERALSDDFLYECKKAVRERTESEVGLELRLLIPRKKHNSVTEQVIKKRLHAHFKKHFAKRLKERKETRKWGLFWCLIGSALIYSATLLHQFEGMFFDFLLVILEPAGWFTMWIAFDMLFSAQKEKEPDFLFYKAMANVKLSFREY